VSFEFNLQTEAVTSSHPVEPHVVSPQTSVREVIEQFAQQRDGAVVVCQDSKLLGIFTERDALRRLADDDDLDVPVSQLMVRDPSTVRASDTVAKAIQRMHEGGYRRLPIVDDEGRPVGVVKVSGIVHYLVEHVPEAVYNLPPNPRPVMQQREGA